MCLAKNGELLAQQISNVLHILAKKRYKTSILQQLEWRAEAISEQFNSQNVANTLLAFATMRTKPGQRMIEQQERFVGVGCGLLTSLVSVASRLDSQFWRWFGSPASTSSTSVYH